MGRDVSHLMAEPSFDFPLGLRGPIRVVGIIPSYPAIQGNKFSVFRSVPIKQIDVVRYVCGH